MSKLEFEQSFAHVSNATILKHDLKNTHFRGALPEPEETWKSKIDASFRGDPYPGALTAIDYLRCREGNSFEERKYNLVMAWGDLIVDENNESIKVVGSKGKIGDFISLVQRSETKNILSKSYSSISNNEISRYYMQVRYGSSYSKAKHIRVFSYFADAILFPDGSLWRDA